MKSILEEILSRKINTLKKQKIHGQKILNLIKGDPLHFIVLDFLYSHKIYKHSVMYGGSALRIIYDLPRMSVDLDFQINFPLNPEEGLKRDIIDYFQDRYGYDKLDVAVGNQGKDTIVVKISFPGLDKFKLPDINFAVLKIRLDFNKFDTDDFQKVFIPMRGDYYNFNLKTYPISTLMASKVAAVLNRVQYGVSDDGKTLLADYKGRDIYDLIWYLQKGVIPNLHYLQMKRHDYKNYPSLFKKIRERLAKLNDGGKALRTDLSHLYLDPQELDEWMNQWSRFFLESLQNYSFAVIKDFKHVRVMQNFDTDVFTFSYYFETDLDQEAAFVVVVSDNYVEDFPIEGFKRDDMRLQTSSGIDTGEEKIKEYAGLFYSKIEHFLKRVGHISPRLKIQTRLIQYGHGGYDPDTMVAFTDKELMTCQFEDLL